MGSRGTFVLRIASNPCLVVSQGLCWVWDYLASGDRFKLQGSSSIDYTGPRGMESSMVVTSKLGLALLDPYLAMPLIWVIQQSGFYTRPYRCKLHKPYQ